MPEVGERTIEIKALAREPGHRTKIAVSSIDTKVDAVGACVGVRGSRIKNIVEELGGEKIDIVRWNESSQILITNALKPAEVAEVSPLLRARPGDGRRERRPAQPGDRQARAERPPRRPADRLGHRHPDAAGVPERACSGSSRRSRAIEGITQEMVDKIIALGLIDVRDIEEVGDGPLMEELGTGRGDWPTRSSIGASKRRRSSRSSRKQEEGRRRRRPRPPDRQLVARRRLAGVDGQAFANPLLPAGCRRRRRDDRRRRRPAMRRRAHAGRAGSDRRRRAGDHDAQRRRRSPATASCRRKSRRSARSRDRKPTTIASATAGRRERRGRRAGRGHASSRPVVGQDESGVERVERAKIRPERSDPHGGSRT